MKYNILGKTNVRISHLGLGGGKMGKALLSQPKDPIEEVIELAIDHGINFFDLANVYCIGQSESIVGNVLKSRRNKFLLSTKGGRITPTAAKVAHNLSFLGPLIRPFMGKKGYEIQKSVPRKSDFSPLHLESELEKSLRRLQTDYVDFYFLHGPPIGIMQNSDAFEWMDKMKSAGKIRFSGVSIYTPSEAEYVGKSTEVDLIQIPYNLTNHENYQAFFELNKVKQMGLIARSPFERGLLTSQNLHKNPEITANLQPGQHDGMQTKPIEKMALDFVASNPNIHNILSGTGSKHHMLQNLQWLK